MFEPKTFSIVDALQGNLPIGESPFYALLGDRYLHIMEVEPGSVVEVFGNTYRLVRRREEYGGGAAEYARPWALWAVLRLRQKVRESFWAVVTWLYHHGIIHVRTPEAQCSRWRDLGLGPDPKWKKGSSDAP